MTTNTPLGQIPIPEDTDLLASTGEYIRDLGNAIDQLVVFKGTDEVVNNSAALQDDNELTFPTEAGKHYAFEFHLVFRCGDSGIDAKVAIKRSVASGDLTWSVVGLDPALAGGTIGEAELGGVYQGGSADFLEVGIASGVTGVHIFGTYRPVANADITLRWCQKTATADDLILSDGSYLKAQVVS